MHTPVFKTRSKARLTSSPTASAAFPDVEFVLTGRRGQNRPRRQDGHQKRHHLLVVRNVAGRAVHELRIDLPGGPALGADRQRTRKRRLQPLQHQAARHAHRNHRPERRVHRQTTKIALRLLASKAAERRSSRAQSCVVSLKAAGRTHQVRRRCHAGGRAKQASQKYWAERQEEPTKPKKSARNRRARARSPAISASAAER